MDNWTDLASQRRVYLGDLFIMKAIVVEQAGGPEVLQIRDIPKPEPRSGWVLIKVKAFGLNRSEMFTRQGHSPASSSRECWASMCRRGRGCT